MTFKTALALSLCACGMGCTSSSAPDTKAKDEADIRALEARFVSAFKAKDVNAIMACYVPDQSMVVFDAGTPRQFNGASGYRKDWEDYLAAFPGPWDTAMSDLEITVGGDVAYGHNVETGSFTDKEGKKMDITVRVTDGYKKIGGQWLIAHEHVSVPIDMATMKPDLNSK
jgi:ketosteroid isomerase-like protein